MSRSAVPALAVDGVAVAATVARRRALLAVAAELSLSPDSAIVHWIAGARVAHAVAVEIGDDDHAVLADMLIAARPPGDSSVPSSTDLRRARQMGWEAEAILDALCRDGGRAIVRDIRDDDARAAEARAEGQRRAEAAQRGKKIAELLDVAGDHMQAPDARERALSELSKMAPGEFAAEIAQTRASIARVKDQLDATAQANAQRRREAKQAEINAQRTERDRFVALGARVPS